MLVQAPRHDLKDGQWSAALLPGWDDSCCGLAPLLDHMAARMRDLGEDLRPEAQHAIEYPHEAPPWFDASPVRPPTTDVPVRLTRRA